MSQTERILFIDRKLRSQGSFTISQVCKEFEISSRQVKRDIEYMRDRFEAPIEWDFKEKSYHYSKSFDHLQFLDQHLLLTYLSMQSMLKNENYFPAVSEELLNNIEQMIPKDYITLCDKIQYQVPQANVMKPELFYEICTALKKSLCLKLFYISSKGIESSRIVEPCRLINYSGSWYLLSFDRLREDFRTFQVSRIKKTELTEQNIPKRDNTFEEKLERLISNGFGIFFGEKTETVTIDFFSEAANIIKTQIWHPKQKLENITQNGLLTIRLSFPTARLTEVLSKTLSFGSEAIPVSPPKLVELWKNEIKKMNDAAGKF